METSNQFNPRCVCGGSTENPNADCERCQMLAELARLKSEKEAAERDNDAGREVLRRAWREFNAIRASDGAPAGVCHDYWNEMTESLHALVGDDDAKPWMTKATRELVRPYENRNADLSSRLVDAELALTAATSRAEALERERDEAKEQLQTVHSHVAEALSLLGVDISVNGYIPDSWTLREQCHIAKGKLTAATSRAEALEKENQRLMDGLKALKADVHWPIDFYAKNGPSVTSPAGHEYEHTDYVLAKMEELESAIDALLQPAKEVAGGK